jgi:hypothetical protein
MAANDSSAIAETAGTARAEAAHVAETAGTQAREVMHQAAEQAQSAMGQMQQNLRSRADEEAAKLASTLHDASRQMQSMAEAGAEQQTFAASLVREGANAAERFASHLDDGGVQRVVGDLRGWARRNPGGFLLGAGVAGFLIGRIARNVGQQGSSESPSANGQRQFTDYYGTSSQYLGAAPELATPSEGSIDLREYPGAAALRAEAEAGGIGAPGAGGIA